jgi:hypothetical protein
MLNEDGRHVEHGWSPVLSAPQLERWTRRGFALRTSKAAADWLRVACFGTRALDMYWETMPSEAWNGFRVNAHKRGLKIYLGQYDNRGPLILEAWVRDEQRLHESVSSPDATERLAYALQYHLKNGWYDERY